MFQCFVQAPDMSNEDVTRGINQIRERVRAEAQAHEVLKESPVLAEELESNQIKGIYLRCKYNIEEAVLMYLDYIQWRRRNKLSEITSKDCEDEIKSNLAVWKGHDKENNPVCIITGRHLDIESRSGTYSSFNKFLLHTVETGCKLANESNSPDGKITLIYDRRGLEFRHISSIIARHCRPTIECLNQFYGGRINKVFILHVNWFYGFLYYWFLRPFLGWMNLNEKLFVLETKEELLKHIEADQLHLFDENTSYFSFVAAPEINAITSTNGASTADEANVTPYKAVEGVRVIPKDKIEEPENYATIATTINKL